MRLLMLASLGGAIGAGARHIVNVVAGRILGPAFPWSTLIVNAVGSFAMGLLVAYLARRVPASIELRTFAATGVLGGFTTFSAFSLDAVALSERGETGLAILYVSASVVLAIAGLILGLWTMRSTLA